MSRKTYQHLKKRLIEYDLKMKIGEAYILPSTLVLVFECALKNIRESR